MPEAYQQLIEWCWEQEPRKRPSFDRILKELRTNEDFITPFVQIDDYLDYVHFIVNYKTTFGDKRIKIDQYIKRKSPTFTKVVIKNDDVAINLSSP